MFRRPEVRFLLLVTSPLHIAWLIIHPSIHLRDLVHLTLQYEQTGYSSVHSISLFSLVFLQVHAFTSFSNLFVFPTTPPPHPCQILVPSCCTLLTSYCNSHVSRKTPSSLIILITLWPYLEYKRSEAQAVLLKRGKNSVCIKSHELKRKFKATNILCISKETNKKVLQNLDAKCSHIFVLGKGDKGLWVSLCPLKKRFCSLLSQIRKF